jgi:hypothetical protein
MAEEIKNFERTILATELFWFTEWRSSGGIYKNTSTEELVRVAEQLIGDFFTLQ